MKRGTPNHPKVMDLAGALGITRAHAVGLLEMMWHFTAQYTPAGDIGKYSDAAIAFHIGWENAPETLLNALCATRWLDQNASVRLYVHDWHEHADDSVHMALARKTLHFANGVRPSMSRVSKDDRKQLEELYLEKERTRNAQETHGNAQETHCLALPCLAKPIPAVPVVHTGSVSEKTEEADSKPSDVDMDEPTIGATADDLKRGADRATVYRSCPTIVPALLNTRDHTKLDTLIELCQGTAAAIAEINAAGAKDDPITYALAVVKNRIIANTARAPTKLSAAQRTMDEVRKRVQEYQK